VGALVQALETFQGSQGLCDVVSYCEDFLARWPEEFSRPAPSTWVSALLAGEDTPHLRLVTHLAISGRKIGPEECYRYIVDSEYFPAHIRSQYAAKLER
jgi:hypothetical protein